METKRQKQIRELLRRQLSMVLMEEGSYIFEKALSDINNWKKLKGQEITDAEIQSLKNIY